MLQSLIVVAFTVAVADVAVVIVAELFFDAIGFISFFVPELVAIAAGFEFNAIFVV